MKRLTIFFGSKSLICLLLFDPTFSFAADVVLQKAPPLTVREAPAYPENLAESKHISAVSVYAIPVSHRSLVHPE